jgi:hypothetical protein
MRIGAPGASDLPVDRPVALVCALSAHRDQQKIPRRFRKNRFV